MTLAGRSSATEKIEKIGLGASMRGQDERITGQDLGSSMDVLLFPLGGAGYHKAVTG